MVREESRLHYRQNLGRSIFSLFNGLFMLSVVIITLYPILYVVFASLSDAMGFITHRGILLRPVGFSLEAYKTILVYPMIGRGYLNTLIIVTGGVAVNILMTSIGAYFLSRKGVLFRNTVMFGIVFTMYFSGGLIPFYFTVKQLGIDNSLLALILPGAISTMNLIIMRTSFMSIPDSMEESAKIDGARHITILFRIILPLSLPTVAVMVLYYGVGHWNSWFNALLFIRDRQLLPLQVILREILISNTMEISSGIDSSDEFMVREIIKYSAIVISIVPILMLYPFLQKYFIKGVMIGALKE